MYIEHVASKTQLIHREVAGKVEVRIEGSPASQEETPASQEETPASRRILWRGQLYITIILAAVLVCPGPGPRAEGARAQGGKGPSSQGEPWGEGCPMAQGPGRERAVGRGRAQGEPRGEGGPKGEGGGGPRAQ